MGWDEEAEEEASPTSHVAAGGGRRSTGSRRCRARADGVGGRATVGGVLPQLVHRLLARFLAATERMRRRSSSSPSPGARRPPPPPPLPPARPPLRLEAPLLHAIDCSP
jgi:hypothetical protein